MMKKIRANHDLNIALTLKIVITHKAKVRFLDVFHSSAEGAVIRFVGALH